MKNPVRTNLYAISDLHLGGTPATDRGYGFQMCPRRTQEMLARFIDRLPASRRDEDCWLVVAGDIVDFLAEEPFTAFTSDPVAACLKLDHIIESTEPVWTALRRFVVERGGVLVLLLGNHDIELSLPGVRQSLLDRIGPGRISFIYDNEAFTLGPILIEHGNRFDAWNAVPHDALRRVRSQLSRQLPVLPEFPALPGSRLVVDVMNPLKKDYPFIDLLKPEDAGALPIAAALGAVGFRDAWQFFGNFRRQWAVDYEENGEPRDEELIASIGDDDQALFDLAEDVSNAGSSGQIGAVGGLLGRAGGALEHLGRTARLEALHRAFRGRLDIHRDTFTVDKEAEVYLAPARRSVAAGFRVVVYGHTHLAKCVPLVTATADPAVYLNLGTWADLMRVPDAVWSNDEDLGRASLRSFVDDLERGALDRWRRAVPTYARIALSESSVVNAKVYFADCDEELSTEGLLQRLAAGGADA